MNSVTRKIGRIATVGAIAMLLAGLAPPAEAKAMVPRLGTRAGAIYGNCLFLGGDPFYFEFFGVWELSCDLGDEGTVSFGGYDRPAPPDEWNLTASRSAIGGESALTADDRGHDGADAADRGKRKAHKQHKHKPHAGKRR